MYPKVVSFCYIYLNMCKILSLSWQRIACHLGECIPGLSLRNFASCSPVLVLCCLECVIHLFATCLVCFIALYMIHVWVLCSMLGCRCRVACARGPRSCFNSYVQGGLPSSLLLTIQGTFHVHQHHGHQLCLSFIEVRQIQKLETITRMHPDRCVEQSLITKLKTWDILCGHLKSIFPVGSL